MEEIAYRIVDWMQQEVVVAAVVDHVGGAELVEQFLVFFGKVFDGRYERPVYEGVVDDVRLEVQGLHELHLELEVDCMRTAYLRGPA